MARSLWLAAASLAVAAPAAAQVAVDAGVAIATDDRRRGISWSDGEIAPSANATARLPAGFDLGVRVSGTRGDPRHGGADAVVDATAGFTRDLAGGFRLDAFAAGHFFAGAAGRLDYGEGGLGLSYALGPAEVGVDARYAPPQAAIGGDNLYVSARTRVGVPATPYTIVAAIGHSSGDVDDPLRAARLRPGGAYADWSIGVDRVMGPLTIGVAYTGTDVSGERAASRYANLHDAGDKLTARIAFGF